jgi:hypothetical protein
MPSSGAGIAAAIAAVVIFGAVFVASLASKPQAHEPDRSFQQVFMWG